MPLEVSMGYFASPPFQLNQQCCKCIGNDRALCAQDAVLTTALSGDQKILFEIRCVASLNLKKIYTFFGAERMEVPQLAVDYIEICFTFNVRPSCHEPDDAIVIILQQLARSTIKMDATDTQLGRSKGTRNHRQYKHSKDE